jgi:hypothetical protein
MSVQKDEEQRGCRGVFTTPLLIYSPPGSHHSGFGGSQPSVAATHILFAKFQAVGSDVRIAQSQVPAQS